MRSFWHLNWEVFGSELAKAMNFKSIYAQQYARSGGDNHKTWELIRIFYLGTLDELLRPYVKHCIAIQVPPTAKGYLKWKEESVTNPSYMYMFEQVTVYAQSIMNMRGGLRRNNIDMINSARTIHAPIFHGRNHGKYQEIEIDEMTRNVLQPQPVKSFMDSTSSISNHGPSRGEDFDFKTEGINQNSKAWVSHGVPTESNWLRIFRNLENLEKVMFKLM